MVVLDMDLRVPSHTVDGRNPIRTTWKQWETIVCWYLQGNRIILGFLRWREMDFVHPRTFPWTASGLADVVYCSNRGTEGPPSLRLGRSVERQLHFLKHKRQYTPRTAAR